MTRLHLGALTALYLLLNLISAGTGGLLLAIGFLALAGGGYRLLPAATVMRMRRADPAPASIAARLDALLSPLARRAALEQRPTLWLLPRPDINALCVQGSDGDALALSVGALRECPPEEVAAICAHELAHLANGDQALMQIASFTHAVTLTLGLFIVLMGLLALPLRLLFDVEAPAPSAWLAGLLLPPLSLLVFQSLARTRELAADLTAARWMGDPGPMAKVLLRIARFEAAMARIGPTLRVPAWLSSHPPVDTRLAQLDALARSEDGGR
jgi:heat shock protein HtpX